MKKTKVKINISESIKKKINNIKEKIIRVIEKIKTNLKENKGKRLTKQSVKYYTILVLMVIMAFVSTYANIKEYQKINTEDYEQYNLVENKDVEANSTNVITEEKSQGNDNAKKENVVVYDTAISSISTNIKNAKENYPVSGKIIQEFSSDNVIYYESLGVWKTHTGVDISCEENEKVVNVIDGKVVGIYQDDVFGNSVVVEGEEYMAIYSSLASNILVSIGNKLNKGDIIGYAGTNAAEENLGVHLHFELLKSGEYVNPSAIGIN